MNDEQQKEEAMQVTSLISFYDKVEEYPNCTVQILTNTKTGEVSVGWWKNDPDDPDEEEAEW